MKCSLSSMCGLVYVKRKDNKPAHSQVLKRYYKQKDRGEDGFGFIAIDKGNHVAQFHRYMEEDKAKKKLESLTSSHVLFHHRFPTSTPNLPESAHPIKVSNKELLFDYYVTHNGVIRNDTTLKRQHERIGYTYTTAIQTQYVASSGITYVAGSQFNDSEALAIELARTIELLQPAVLAEGAIAYIVLQVDKKTGKANALYYGHNGGNSLTIDKQPNGLVIASQGGKPLTMGDYRLDLEEDTHESLDLHIPPYEVRQQAIGYQYSGMYSDYAPSAGHFISDSSEYKTMSADELDEEIDGIQNMLAEIEGDIAIARECGEMEEEEALVIEKKNLSDQLNRAERAYNEKATYTF